MNENFSNEQLEVVRHVLFGNQKQASAINDAVARIVATTIYSETNDSAAFATEEAFANKVEELLNGYIHGASYEDAVVALIAGFASLKVLQDMTVSKHVNVFRISDESPKRVFSICSEYETDTEGVGVNGTEFGTITTEADVARGDKQLSYREQAEKLKDAIIPVAPDAMKEEIGDNEYMLALCAAPYYFGV